MSEGSLRNQVVYWMRQCIASEYKEEAVTRKLAKVTRKLAKTERTIAALQAGCEQWQLSAKHAQEELDEAIELLQVFFDQGIDHNHYQYVFVQMERELRDRIGAFLEKNKV